MKTIRVALILFGLVMIYGIWLGTKPQMPIAWALSAADRLRVYERDATTGHMVVVADYNKRSNPVLFSLLSSQSNYHAPGVAEIAAELGERRTIQIDCPSIALRLLGYPDRMGYYYYPNRDELGFYRQWCYVPPQSRYWLLPKTPKPVPSSSQNKAI